MSLKLHSSSVNKLAKSSRSPPTPCALSQAGCAEARRRPPSPRRPRRRRASRRPALARPAGPTACRPPRAAQWIYCTLCPSPASPVGFSTGVWPGSIAWLAVGRLIALQVDAAPWSHPAPAAKVLASGGNYGSGRSCLRWKLRAPETPRLRRKLAGAVPPQIRAGSDRAVKVHIRPARSRQRFSSGSARPPRAGPADPRRKS